MNKSELVAFAEEAAKSIKTEEDLNDFRKVLTKITVEAALNAELEHHLGFSKHAQSSTDNSRNGYSSKTLQTEDGTFEVETPRDRKGDFEPKLVKNTRKCRGLVIDLALVIYRSLVKQISPDKNVNFPCTTTSFTGPLDHLASMSCAISPPA